jgi:hypothetical protein
MAEQRTFVFSVVFIIVFSALLVSIPADLQGEGSTANTITPVNPSLVSDFSESVDFLPSDFTYNIYSYTLGGRDWLCSYVLGSLEVAAKVLVGGVLWLGQTEICKFYTEDGADRGTSLSFTEIASDASSGVVRYELEYSSAGGSAGGFVIYWNITAYTTPGAAWTADALYMLHGMGFDATAALNIAQLLLGLLFLQLPEVPLLVNVLIAVPIWASVVYLIWFVIKETLPFV